MTPDRALAFLRADPLRYLLHLKYLHHYPAGVACRYLERDGAAGVLLSYPPDLITWDWQTYPQAAAICLPVAASVPVAAELCQAVAALVQGSAFVCKTCDPLTRAVFAREFPFQPVRAFISYTTALAPAQPADPAVVVGQAVDERCAALYHCIHYSLAELSQFFADGARSFTIFDHDQPVCMCFIYRNFDDIWEIAGVRTVEAARRQGHARRVVTAALSAILARGGRPRYVTERTNTASIRLAESLGLTAFLTVEHDAALRSASQSGPAP